MTIKKSKYNYIYILIIIFICFLVIMPFLWMLMVSLRKKVDIFSPHLFLNFNWENYIKVLNNKEILRYFTNSIILSITSTLLSLILGGIAAYGFARFHWRQKESHAFFILSQKFLPAMAVVIPYFLIAVFFNILDTLLLLTIAYTSFNIPFTIWMMRSFIEDLPYTLEEAAMIDVCSRMQTIWKIVLPLSLSGLIATGIFCIITSWNEFTFANFLTLIYSKTVPTSVMLYLSVSGIQWGEMAATGVLATFPILIFAVISQKYIVRGLTFGAIKE